MWCLGSMRSSISVSDSPNWPLTALPRWSEPTNSTLIGASDVGIISTNWRLAP